MPMRNEINAPWRDPADMTPLRMIARHPLLILLALAISSALAAVYLRNATPQYMSTAVLRVQQPPLSGSAETPRTADETAVFLNAELAVLTSTPVLESALANKAVLNTQTARAIAAAPEPASAMRSRLRATLGRKDNLISIELNAASPGDAAIVVNAVVEAYVARQKHLWEENRRKMLAVLETQKAQQSAEAKETSDTMLRVLRQAGSPVLDSRQKLQEIAALSLTLRATQQEEAAAQTQYTDAARPLMANPALQTELERIITADIAPTRSDAENEQLRLLISELKAKRQEMINVRSFLPSHPQIVTLDRQLAETQLTYAASMHRHWTVLKTRARQLQATINQQEASAIELAARASEYAQAELNLKRQDEKLAILAGRIAELTTPENTAMQRVEVVEQGRPAARPTTPDRARTLVIATAFGLLCGAVAAYAREAALLRRHEISGSLPKRRLAAPHGGRSYGGENDPEMARDMNGVRREVGSAPVHLDKRERLQVD